MPKPEKHPDAGDVSDIALGQEVALPDRYLSGGRLIVACLGLAVCIFLPTVEIAVVSTSLVTMSADLGGFDKSSWVITAYISVFTGFLIIWSKLGHLVGLKSALLSSTVIFVAFSAGCGASQSMNELITFRALQGIGGSGMMSLPTITFYQMVPSAQYSKMNAVSSCSLAVGLLVSPVIGGALSNGNHWRWVFYLNCPAGALCALLIALAIPNRFPRHADPADKKDNAEENARGTENGPAWFRGAIDFFRQADVVGALLLLGAVVFLVAALQEGGSVSYPWSSGVIIACFVACGSLLVAFLAWQWWASRDNSPILPMFPRSFTHNTFLHKALFGSVLVGAPMSIAAIELPQRYQLVNGSSPLQAGVQFLAYGAPFPAGVVLASMLAGRRGIPFFYVILFGAALQVIGFTLLSTSPTTFDFWQGQLGYSVVAGLGTGITGGTYYLLAPICIDKKEQYLGVGAGVQARMMGGAIGIAVVNSIWINYVRSHLADLLPLSEVDSLLVNIGTLDQYPAAVQQTFRIVCGDGYNLQMRATLGFAAAHVLVLAAIWRRPQYRLKEGLLEPSPAKPVANLIQTLFHASD